MGGVRAGAGDGGTLLQSWALQGRADRANRAGQAGKAGRAGRAKQGREGQRRAWQGRLGRASMAGQTGLAGHGNPAQGKAGGCVMVWCVAWGVFASLFRRCPHVRAAGEPCRMQLLGQKLHVWALTNSETNYAPPCISLATLPVLVRLAAGQAIRHAIDELLQPALASGW